ncbi:hypothetical protein TrCOL_g669 [Triparma columacea]|uniref:tRNA-dihydrouridine(16/17) synthase [NAD(P)(+)] n=1 Tax=Triparma columacea TaxID=722753 RepID=A0A9W7GL12_9STRA|nr:hypothetical protein TrCOL_g669 [Triparma columacea]
MVGASELPFRLLCRKYGATIAYTPMISSARFCLPAEHAYREEQFQTNATDRPLVAHFSANKPNEMAAAAKLVESRCDAIDLNLGCPQRVAYVGHYGSYLLDDVDRELVLSIVSETVKAVSIPVFVKIRLLDTVEKTITLVTQLKDAGASLVAIHARHRASFERTGAGARDGPAMLDQVKVIKQKFPMFPIIANGNIITFDDCKANLELTGADGVMSAEGILNNPALFVDAISDPAERSKLKAFASDKVNLALEYLDLLEDHPATMRTVAFHTRRMLKEPLTEYQLIDDVINAITVEEVRSLVLKCRQYQQDPSLFKFDTEKAAKVKEALEKKKHEEGKRKRYEDRMKRKAKREGKPLDHYLNIGAELPSLKTVSSLMALTKEKQLAIWNASHGQHCMVYHLSPSGCPRGRSCAFLHCDIGASSELVAADEVAG